MQKYHYAFFFLIWLQTTPLLGQIPDECPLVQDQIEINPESTAISGNVHIIHTTRPENLINILQTGKLKPVDNLRMLTTDEKFSQILQNTGNRMPILVFDNLSILNQSPFQYALLGNDIIVSNDVPLHDLTTIIVKKGTKQQYIDELTKANILPPNQLTWDDLFVEMPALKEDHLTELNRYANHWLKPYSANSDDIVLYAFRQYQQSGPAIVNQLIREYPGLKDLYAQSAQVHEGYTVKEHILRVLAEFEKVLAHTPLDKQDYAEITHDLEKVLRTMIALHDIGKGLGRKEDQHKHTIPILQTAMERWGFRYSEIRLATALVKHDHVGEMLQGIESPHEALAHLQAQADYANLPLEPFLKLQLLFWLSDAGSYPFLRTRILTDNDNYGRQVPNNPTWNQLLDLASEQASKPIKDIKQVEMPLFPLYALEFEDEQHRYGLDMQNQHDLYEQTLIKNPNWEWRDKFWEWLDVEGPGLTMLKVNYLNEKERLNYRVSFKKGKLQIPVPYDETSELLYVLDNQGNLHVGHKDRGSTDRKGFFHSSFLSGVPVMGCGVMHVDAAGNLIKIDDRSGHYRPSEQQVFQTLKFLLAKGVDLSQTTLEFEVLWEARLYKQKHNIPFRAPINALDWFKIKNWKVFSNRSLQMTVEDLRNTQKVVTAAKPVAATSDHHYEGRVLVLLPSENQNKVALVRERFSNFNVVEIKTVPWDFGYQQQHYNRSGELAALKRGEYAEQWLTSKEGQEYLQDHPFESIYWVSIVNYIQIDSKKKNPPVDYGLIMIKNVKTGVISSISSDGVTLDPRYVEEAMRYGYLPEHRYGTHDYSKDKHWDYDTMPGNVRVGKVLTTHIYNLKNDDWHEIAANKSRYSILSDSFKNLTIP